jgi:hypothetical protein
VPVTDIGQRESGALAYAVGMDTMPSAPDPECVRCESAMERVAVVRPFREQAGLLAYICPKCGCCRSDMIPPTARPTPR